ncbi:MAG: peptide ABC transporter substrate-binding protein [Caldilineaceae bacterium]|nr:peptide ABC transporter substrate-binding protein [Caldilineaceae bacterium]
MKHNTWIKIASLLMVVALLSSACAAPAAPAAAPAGESAATEAEAAAPAAEDGKKILRVAYGAEIDTLNALTSQNLTDIEITMVDGLIMSDNNNSYVPVLAKEIPTTENGGIVVQDDGTIEMTWNLHEGVKWHDGEEFTSADVCFTLDFIQSEAGQAVYNQTDYMGIIDCQMPDPYTVVFVWDKVFAAYATLFDTILPEHVLAGQDVLTYDAYNRSPLGTGPFKFVEWKPGEYIRVEKNTDYWRGDEYPMIDEIVFSFIPDPNTRVNALKAGEYDLGQILPNQVKEVQDLEGYKVDLVPANSWIIFEFNVATERGQKLFSDPNVRKAIFHAIDREAIVEGLMEGTVQIANSAISPTSPYHNPDVPVYAYDPAQAAQMLDEAGWTPGADGIREKDGERLSFTIINRNSRPERTAIAQAIQAMLKDVGVEVKFEDLENAAWLQRWLSTDWEAIIGGWIIPADPSLTALYACEGSNNFTGFCNPELDAAMIASDEVFDFADRKPLMDEVQLLMAEEGRELPLYYNVLPYVMREDLQGFKGSGTNLGSFWNVYEWSLGE